MAWCVGSVFPTPHLLTGSAVSSVSSLVLDPPQCLLNTGCAFPYGVNQQSDTHHQVECFLDEYKEAFFPEELLIENLQEDMPLHPEISRSFHSVGNRLEGVKNREGRLQLFFPVGENTDRIGSCILFPELNSAFSKGKLCCATDNNLHYTSSSSLCQPILQIGANKIGSFWDSEFVPLATRTLYQVHWLTSQIQDDINSLTWRGVENFDYGTSHVVWNPHFPGEAAVVLENGDVSIFDLNSPGSHVISSMFKVEEQLGNEDFNFFNHGLSHKRKRRKETEQSSGFNNSVFMSAPQHWWTCEYAWHPKNLLVGGQTEIFLIDMRQKHGNKQFQSSIARVDCSSGLFSYCNLMHRTELFTALTRGDYDNMFQFAAATTNHLRLYDVRRPSVPLLQWEHRMQDGPPRLLQMHCLSDVCSRFHDLLDKHSLGGRFILGCSFKSGELQASFYGPKPLGCPSNSENIKLDWNIGTVAALDQLYAWEFPKSLKNWKAHCHKNLEHAFEAHENNLRTLFANDHTAEQLTGLLNFSIKSGSSSFTILQLTGSGSILSQSLKLSEEIGFSNHEPTCCVPEKRTIIRTNSGYHHACSRALQGSIHSSYLIKSKRGTKQYRMEYFPSFLKHLKYGSMLPKFQQKIYSNANLYQKSTSANQEECSKIETEVGHTPTLVNEVLDDIMRRQTTCSHCIAARSSVIDVKKSEFQSSKSNDDNQSTEDFFSKMDAQLSPVIISFKDTASGTELQSEELHILSGLKDIFQQWQQNFQPYINYSNLDVNNNHNCESCRTPL